MPQKKNTELRTSLALVTVAGCLALVYMPCINSAIRTDYFRECGFTKRHFGILHALVTSMFVMQFVGALLSNRLKRRKPVVMIIFIAGRLIWLGIAALPFVFPAMPPSERIIAVLTLAALSAALLNLAPPIWFSWMSDVIPKRVLNRYWGNRSRNMWAIWVVTSIGMALFSFNYEDMGLSDAQGFAIVACVGVLAGVVDILLFIWVPEPPNTRVLDRNIAEVLLEPLRQRQSRSFLIWNCAYMFSAMLGAAYMILYLLEIGVPQWQVVLLSSVMGAGYSISSGLWGRMADRHGHRPILILCAIFKPLAPLMFFLITRSTAMLVLVPFFLFDCSLNAGLQIAKNGFMLKLAPKANRSMFVAAITSLPFIAGGLGALVGGEILTYYEDWCVEIGPKSLTNYHIIFAICCTLRIGCIFLARRIREPDSSRPIKVLMSISGEWPLRLVTFPIGMYRRLRKQSSEEPKTGGDDDGGDGKT